jgi:hypothetical protein
MNTNEIQLTPSERKVLAGLDSPIQIQSFLNAIPYNEDEFYRCPLRVLQDRKAHCFDGALFGAMALRQIGHPALILELIPNGRDDDHLLALFKRYDHWGAVAKSNFTGLRYREPIYRSLRELVISYFEDYFNSAGEKTLAGYRGPINMKVFDRLNWMSSDTNLERLSNEMNRYQIRPILSDEMAAALAPVDERSLRAGLMDANEAGLFRINEQN